MTTIRTERERWIPSTNEDEQLITDNDGHFVILPFHSSLNTSRWAMEMIGTRIQIFRSSTESIQSVSSIDQLVHRHFEHIGRVGDVTA